MSSTVVKAVLAYCRCRDGSGTGAVLASRYDSSTELMETYTARSSAQDGAAILTATLPALMGDKEFSDAPASFEVEYQGGFADMKAATEYLAILCDNAYRRVKDDTCPAHLKLNIDDSGNVVQIGRAHV